MNAEDYRFLWGQCVTKEQRKIVDDLRCEAIVKEVNPPIIMKPGGIHFYTPGQDIDRLHSIERFTKGWREFDLGKFAVSSIKMREEV